MDSGAHWPSLLAYDGFLASEHLIPKSKIKCRHCLGDNVPQNVLRASHVHTSVHTCTRIHGHIHTHKIQTRGVCLDNPVLDLAPWKCFMGEKNEKQNKTKPWPFSAMAPEQTVPPVAA